MPDVVRYREEGKYVLVQSRGDLTIERMYETRKVVVRLLSEHKAERVLFDTWDVTSVPSTFPLFNYGTTLLEAGMPPTVRIAICGDVTTLWDLEFLELVVRNRGIAIRVFQERSDALQWLERSPCDA